ncbi:flavonol 3-O-glucosyltransferase UGT89B1-like [Magnolia sinica]|uniref:flavonol 3-O-glucosyltransferase UGT89B1-like n=1 Tax=Magnolia sinica TaxID=86752 RepID=UPI00265A0DF7|nr:flavonol 3-O-glucosyltransferase UGT89B1-like [Magnolia sinica]
MSSAPVAHVLVFPHPAQGHMIPLLDHAHQLSARGLSITVLVTPKNLPILDPLLSKSPSIQTLIFPLPSHPTIPPGVENLKDLPPTSSTAAIVRALSELRNPIIHWFRSHPSPPVAIISDFFLGWTDGLARQLGIPRIVFYSSGALAVAVVNDLFAANMRREGTVVSLPDVPGSPALKYLHLPTIYRRSMEFAPASEDWAFVRDCMIANTTSWGAIYNTFAALEHTYLEHASKRAGHVWAVGPLILDGVGPAGRGGTSSLAAGDVMAWLGGCPEGSVVYVSFGSEVLLNQQQTDAIAAGLEASGARFIWTVKIPTSGHVAGDYGTIPGGFEERVAGRGRVIRGWAPQVEILEHPATGAFVTHCGWNSTLEGISAGVVLLAWPMGAEQFVNARLLVEETGLAVRVGEGSDSVPDPVELARVLAESVGGTGSARARAKEMSKAAWDAVKEGGSSFRDLDELVTEISALTPNSEKEITFER